MQVEQKLQEEVAQMCAKLEMMQNEQEKKKGNEEAWLNALVREHVEKRRRSPRSMRLRWRLTRRRCQR